ncbi:LysR family transcriptional regulator [uncultured Roseovarius sp.]|uniref:LysR substrate-binding domain-containing protein n=1 Tax=uncultured Roseovarius sp. TaxID=293344 RepID=UPI002601C048|nr:LysR family transcriptional regulator [uncultured Roseovarius sp.]
MDRIDTMRAFVAVAEEASFTLAARKLGMSNRLASKYVKELESRLSVQLLNRTTRSVALTDVGLAYLERCRPILAQFEQLNDAVQQRHAALAGPIRVTAPTGFGSLRLPGPLGLFMTEHPNVTVEMRLSDTRLALVEEGIDLAIRIGRLQDSSLVARKLGRMPLIVCAAPGYLERRGHPAHPESLATHDCLIDANQFDAATWRFGSPGNETSVRVSGSCTANSPVALAALAMDGIGVARCPEYVVADALCDGRLKELFADRRSEDLGLYAIYPPNRHLTARVRALIDHLAEAFGKHP